MESSTTSIAEPRGSALSVKKLMGTMPALLNAPKQAPTNKGSHEMEKKRAFREPCLARRIPAIKAVGEISMTSSTPVRIIIE